MKIFITSDTHFSHPNITGPKISRWESGYRDFDTIQEMNKTLVEGINKHVKEDDILYFLGDWCFGGHEKTPLYRSFINCKTIYFTRGNHDKRINLYKDCFTSITNDLTLNYKNHNFYMSHYADQNNQWPGKDKGVIHLYGHSHGSRPDVDKSMDVGVDVAYRLYGEYRPFYIDEIVDIMDAR